MQAVRTLDQPIPARQRLGYKLGLVFVGVFLVVFILIVAWTMFAALADRRQSAADSGVATPVIVIDPKIRSDLAKALAFDGLPTQGEVLNPFLDRAGISGNVAVAPLRTSTQTGGVTETTTTVGGTSSRVSPGGQTRGSQIYSSSVIEAPSWKSRHDDWLARKKLGQIVENESEVLGVADLIPVGLVSGGDLGAEVMLFSLSLCQTFSFPAGTRFSDGWLNGFDQKEVVFTFQNGIRRKSFATVEPCQAAGDSRMANMATGPSQF